MAGRIPHEFIDELIARSDIVELINRRVPLRKAGKDYQLSLIHISEPTRPY